jgi:hypothetical protein
MQPISVTIGPLSAASANNIATSQTVTGAANVVLNGALVSGGVAYLDSPRRVLITNVGNDAAITFTVYGTTFGGASVSEVLQGTSGSAVASTVDFATVTRIATSGSTSASGITVGTNTVAGSRWVRLDSWADAQTAIQCTATGTVNYTVQVTMNDPNDPISPVDINAVTWLNSNDTDAVTAIGDIFTNFDWTPTYARILLNSGSGTVVGTFAQFNVANK